MPTRREILKFAPALLTLPWLPRVAVAAPAKRRETLYGCVVVRVEPTDFTTGPETIGADGQPRIHLGRYLKDRVAASIEEYKIEHRAQRLPKAEKWSDATVHVCFYDKQFQLWAPLVEMHPEVFWGGFPAASILAAIWLHVGQDAKLTDLHGIDISFFYR